MSQGKNGVHFQHCNQGEYIGSCAYGDEDCPAFGQDPHAIWRLGRRVKIHVYEVQTGRPVGTFLTEADATKAVAAVNATIPSAPGTLADDEASYAAEQELQEIADGAWGGGPALRGAARDRLKALATTNAVQPQAVDVTGEAYCQGVEDAAKVADSFGEPYALHTHTGAMMFRACTEKIAAAIRALATCPPAPVAVDVTGEAGERIETPAEKEALELQWGKQTPDGGWLASPQRSVLERCCAHFEGEIVPVTVKEGGDGGIVISAIPATRPAASDGEVVTGEAGEIERLRTVLDNVADLAEEIRLDLVTHLDEPVRSASWKGVKIRDLALSTLEASTAARPAASGDGGGEVERLRAEVKSLTEELNEEVVSSSGLALQFHRAERLRQEAEAALASMTAERDRLAEALKPFAEFAKYLGPAVPYDMPMTKGSTIAQFQVTAGAFHRANEVLAALASPQADAGERG